MRTHSHASTLAHSLAHSRIRRRHGVAIKTTLLPPLALSPFQLKAKAVSQLRSDSDAGLRLVDAYVKLCSFYRTTPHPDVLSQLRFAWPSIAPSKKSGRKFKDQDLLPVCELLR